MTYRGGAALHETVDARGALSGATRTLVRRLGDVSGMFLEAAGGEAEVYRVFEREHPEAPGDLVYGTTVIQPGLVGEEYFMTRGHYHTDPAAAELYFGLSGQGLILMQNQADARQAPMGPRSVVYIPPGYAHRTVNTLLTEPLVFLVCYAVRAGHDYDRIRREGWRHRVFRGTDGRPRVRAQGEEGSW